MHIQNIAIILLNVGKAMFGGKWASSFEINDIVTYSFPLAIGAFTPLRRWLTMLALL